MQAIEQGVNSFMEGSAVLMNALDEVAKLHPFIGSTCQPLYYLDLTILHPILNSRRDGFQGDERRNCISDQLLTFKHR